MITRSKLAEQLRDYQIRSQHKWALLTIFSPKPQINSRADVIEALSCAFLLCLLVVFSYVTLNLRHFWLSSCILFLGILLPICLAISRHRKVAKKRERRLLLPLSM
ncbi:unnamed protein product [Spirodela intermedia]|uniref:Uncharacterized protein n=2 Tax=Spirodela intermedia TaxID=51605 RepID=A0A7I8JBF2_SPIIN|nr:unnamed protein product [Spirodela intermedia]CAA6667440.1 unnamed protein product [Spirodela intermedia]CAA7404272.1 unnamed protein product [Spirodela intermedia]